VNIWTAKGEKVIFTGKNGHSWQQKKARIVLDVGKEYTIESLSVGGFSSEVYLQEFPGVGFNSVMFENITDPKEVTDRSKYTLCN